MNIIAATDEEIVALRQLLHRAVLHSGMDAAEAALHWNKLLISAKKAPSREVVQDGPHVFGGTNDLKVEET